MLTTRRARLCPESPWRWRRQRATCAGAGSAGARSACRSGARSASRPRPLKRISAPERKSGQAEFAEPPHDPAGRSCRRSLEAGLRGARGAAGEAAGACASAGPAADLDRRCGTRRPALPVSTSAGFEPAGGGTGSGPLDRRDRSSEARPEALAERRRGLQLQARSPGQNVRLSAFSTADVANTCIEGTGQPLSEAERRRRSLSGDSARCALRCETRGRGTGRGPTTADAGGVPIHLAMSKGR